MSFDYISIDNLNVLTGIAIAGNTGTSTQVLTASGDGTCSWAGGGGELISVSSQKISDLQKEIANLQKEISDLKSVLNLKKV